MVTRDERNELAVGGGLLSAGAAGASAPSAINRVAERRAGRKLVRLGTLGGLDERGKPVDPATLSPKRGPHKVVGNVVQLERHKPARYAAQERYAAAVRPALHRLEVPLVGSRGKTVAAAAALGAGAVGGGLVGDALGRVGARHLAAQGAAGKRQTVAKADTDLMLTSPQYSAGIPASRVNPISPLAMLASSTIMLDVSTKAMGRNLSRRQLKRGAKQANRFAGARGMLWSPLGHGQVSTG